ncbi:MAG: ATP-binding protein [Spirochaetales bacterium]|nr:ATP-binding protein [Spirochaetales bacterium]
MIQRNLYIHQIQKSLKRSKITAILGPRQCGKTTLAKEISLQTKSSFLDIESPTDRAKLQNPELYLKNISGLIILDEIQLMPELFSVLRVLSDQSPSNGRFLILGSASPDLIKNASESLAGRVEFINLQGFDIVETGSSSLDRLWVRGGFPLSYLAKKEGDSIAWRESFIRTFLQRDIPQFGINIPSTTLRRFWTMLAHSHGQILNSSQLAKSMGLNNKTIRSYIDILSATYMIRPLQPWFTNIKKRQVKSPKIYFTDTGLLHQLLGITSLDTLHGHPQLGVSWESFAIEQIIRNNSNTEYYFWSTYSGAELDLFFIHKGKKIGIELKFTGTPKVTKSMHSALKDLNLEKLYIIYPGTERYPLHDLIEVCPLTDLIKLLQE